MLKKTIKDLRKEGKHEAEIAASKERKETRELIQQALVEIQKSFQFEVVIKQTENERMKKEITSMQNSISYISNYLIDTELKIAQNRLCNTLYCPIEENPEKIRTNIKNLHKDIGLVRLKIEALKEAIKSYRMTTESTNKKIEELNITLENKIVSNEEEAKNFDFEGNQKIAQGKAENMKLKKELEDYKMIKIKELEVAEGKCNANNSIIELLQNELKNAKDIIFHPVLKLRVHEKLQNYIDEYNGTIKIRAPTNKSSKNYFSRVNFTSRMPASGTDSKVRDSNSDFSPFISKLNLSRKKLSPRETRPLVSKSIQFINNTSGFFNSFI
ncbi:hypothetical protein SteCoe_1620 [Stentor coeruleus]|uniref:Uncharacterized protein n=1 Tax=Stentor coeruleus TaxID=5963 RepID=A0A1R2D1G7_9CILI|nr:hypothetical protein SteCoe_1620 [Stentor coeruleus]